MKHGNISSNTDALQEKGYMNSQIPISSEQSGVYSVSFYPNYNYDERD
jgi:hypothetical protein